MKKKRATDVDWQGTLLLMFASGFAVIALLFVVVVGVVLAGVVGAGDTHSVTPIP